MRGLLGLAAGALVGWVAGVTSTHYLYAQAAERAMLGLQLPGAVDPDAEPELDFSIDLNPDVPWLNGKDDELDLDVILALREIITDEGLGSEIPWDEVDGDEV